MNNFETHTHRYPLTHKHIGLHKYTNTHEQTDSLTTEEHSVTTRVVFGRGHFAFNASQDSFGDLIESLGAILTERGQKTLFFSLIEGSPRTIKAKNHLTNKTEQLSEPIVKLSAR